MSGEIKSESTEIPNEFRKDIDDSFMDALKGNSEIDERFINNLKGGGFGRKIDITSNLTTRNEDLKDEKHPITEVPFKEKPITDAEGRDDTGVFPEFDSKFDVQLQEDLEQASDKEQFDECNKQLKDKVENDPEFAKQFTPEQLEQIKNGDTPDGYTWHHNEEKGKMQLVDSETHAKTGHTGGKVIWGGGNENR